MSSSIGQVTHGLSRDRIYPVWKAIIRRCENPLNEHYKDYGGRGITVCREWHDVRVFAKWAYENGFDPDAPYGECTIERRDVNGNYCPENCYWADMKAQGRNKRSNRFVTYNGATKTITEFAEEYGLLESTIAQRLDLGWSVEAALGTPPDERRGGNRKPIICTTDGKAFGSLIEAAIFYKISYDKIRRCVDKDKEVCGRYFVSL